MQWMCVWPNIYTKQCFWVTFCCKEGSAQAGWCTWVLHSNFGRLWLGSFELKVPPALGSHKTLHKVITNFPIFHPISCLTSWKAVTIFTIMFSVFNDRCCACLTWSQATALKWPQQLPLSCHLCDHRLPRASVIVLHCAVHNRSLCEVRSSNRFFPLSMK